MTLGAVDCKKQFSFIASQISGISTVIIDHSKHFFLSCRYFKQAINRIARSA